MYSLKLFPHPVLLSFRQDVTYAANSLLLSIWEVPSIALSLGATLSNSEYVALFTSWRKSGLIPAAEVLDFLFLFF